MRDSVQDMGSGPRSTLRMFQVDAFADRVFTGNPAAVLVLDAWLPDGLMLSIAQENNLAETAFVKARPDGDWDLRWFTPVHEVDFCGHATLATAHVLLTETKAEAPLAFHTRVGPLRVSRDSHRYRLDVPRLSPEPLHSLPAEIAGVFDAPPVRIFRNFENIFVDLGSAEAVRCFVPDLAAIARLGTVGLVVTGREAEGGRADFVSRYFAPGAGIPEDPVTGSIHATLVPYWAERLGRSRLLAYQASARGGWLACELAGDRIFLVGNAVTFMKADIFLPDDTA
ncbi:MAG: yddE [Reyranella sp.]|nr:yddE [Reyranella sp.]